MNEFLRYRKRENGHWCAVRRDTVIGVESNERHEATVHYVREGRVFAIAARESFGEIMGQLDVAEENLN